MSEHTGPRSTRSRGFTLIELMIVVVIATILISIAIPAYTTQVRTSRRTEAKQTLLDLASREERLFSTRNFYTQDLTQLGYPVAGAITGNYYSVSVVVPDPNWAGPPGTLSFIATATPLAVGGQAQDTQCATFTVTQTGLQRAQNSATADSTALCWR